MAEFNGVVVPDFRASAYSRHCIARLARDSGGSRNGLDSHGQGYLPQIKSNEGVSSLVLLVWLTERALKRLIRVLWCRQPHSRLPMKSLSLSSAINPSTVEAVDAPNSSSLWISRR